MGSVRHINRGHRRPSTEAGPNNETHLPRPTWDTSTELLHSALPSNVAVKHVSEQTSRVNGPQSPR